MQFGEKSWFHKIEEDGINSSVKRRIQGIFVGHHDRTRAIPHIAKSGIVRGQNRTRQTLSDAWESTIMDDLFGNPGHLRLHTAIVETKLTKKLITDEEGTDRLLPRMLVKEPLEVKRGRCYVLSADIEAHGHMRSCPGYALLTSQGKVTKPRRDEFRERVGTIVERILAGEARRETHEDRIAETARVREKRGAQIERGAEDVPMEPWNRDDEQVAVRHADASGGDIRENPARRERTERHPSQQKRIRGSK